MPHGDHAANIRWDNDTNPGAPTWIWPDYHFGTIKRAGVAKGTTEWSAVCDAAAQGLAVFNTTCAGYWPTFWSELTEEERETYWVACKRIARIT